MTGVIVDTNVFSYVYKRDSRATLYAPHLAARKLHLAFCTVAEHFR